MYFRDFRHQIEPNEDVLAAHLTQARERFFTNLSMLQLQLPELAQQLRQLQMQQYTLAFDRSGAGHCIDAEQLAMLWPPSQFLANHAPTANQPIHCALLVARLQDSGEKLIPHLAQQQAPYLLLYVASLELLYASLHFVDWLPLLQRSNLFVQVATAFSLDQPLQQIPQLDDDIATLASHGIPTQPVVILAPQAENTAAEAVWHFQQSLLHNHDCDPVLRRQTHKFRNQAEFRLQNHLINQLRQQPMPYPQQGWTLILCGFDGAIYQAAASLPNLKRVILVHHETLTAEQLAPFQHITLHCCIGSPQEAAHQFIQLLQQLAPETAWFCRLYQAQISTNAQQLRQRIELELRYRVQPALGVRRCLTAAAQACAGPQYMLTRRTLWPQLLEQKRPVLLLGNGPSLTATLTAIQQGQAQGYLIVSCGTTLATLYQANIVPHIHLELELNSTALQQLPSNYLQQIHFIAPLGFHYAWREQFHSHSSFIASQHILDELVPGLPDDTIRVANAFPTVLNLGIALAGQLGAEQLWLAGFDLAFEDLQHHHAVGSLYDQQNSQKYLQSSGELLTVTTLAGTTALTKREFQFAALQSQDLLKQFPQMAAYQLCQGLDLGAKLRTQLEAFSPASLQQKPILTCSKQDDHTQAYWQRIPHACQTKPYLQVFNTTTSNAETYQKLLQQPFLSLNQARRMRIPAALWVESLQRNLAALLLRLGVNSLSELPTAAALFTALLDELAAHEANIL